jgi:hypothetical protein
MRHPAAAAATVGAKPADHSRLANGAVMTSPSRTPPAPPAPAPEPEPDTTAELTRLRAEVSDLQARLGTRRRRTSTLFAVRRVLAALLVVVAAFALVTSVVGLWGARTVLDDDRWVATVAPLPQDPQVAAAVAEYGTTQVFQVLDVEQRLREVLPPQAGFVVGPLTAQLRDQVRKTVVTVLGSDRFQTVWVELNQQAHERAMAILNGTSTVITAGQDRVNIDLLPLINQVLRELSAQLPTMFGKQITLPDLSSGAIPDNLRVRVEDALGVTLPANFAQFTVYDSGQLRALQKAVADAKRYLALFVGSTVLLLFLALLISPRRRRTLLQLGLWLVVAAVVVTVVVRRIRDQLLDQVPAGVYRDGVAAAVTSVFGPLRERGTQLIWIGAILAAVAYLVGPGRLPVWLRRQVARGLRAGAAWTRQRARAARAHGPGWITQYRDPIRVAGVVVAAVLALILSSWTALLIIVIMLAAFEVAVTLIGRAPEQDPAAPRDGFAGEGQERMPKAGTA